MDFLSGLSSSLIQFLIGVINLLPESPFITALADFQASNFMDLLHFFNWFIPIGIFVRITGVWLSGIAVYYGYQIVLRWLKVIG